MLGRKSRQIKKLRSTSELYELAEPHIPQAAEIATRLDAELAQLDGHQIEEQYAQILSDMEREQRIKRVSELFMALPAAMRRKMLTQRYNDDELQLALAKERQAIIDEQLHRDELHILRDAATKNGWIDLSKVPVNTRMRVGLYSADDFYDHRTPTELIRQDDAYRSLTLICIGEASFRLLNDETYDDSIVKVPPIPIHQVMMLGCLSEGDADASFTPEIFYGSPLDCSFGGQNSPIDAGYDSRDLENLRIGHVVLDDVEVMGTNMTQFFPKSRY